jgi:hypothetical protein
VVVGITRWTTKALSLSLALAMAMNLWGCGGQSTAVEVPPEAVVPKPKLAATRIAGKITEVSPPDVIQRLRELLDQYQPQVSIASPSPDEILKDNTVSVQFQVKDLPIFKDERLGLGPHLHVFLDNQPYQAVYDVSKPLVLKDLEAGTHTLRVFAGRPWHESFKNDGAYAQTTFHVFTKTPNNHPNPDEPLLTYSRPQGTYGAEPIMLDFFLNNAPLHFVAQEDEEVADWRIRVTMNGNEFILDRWEPIYLKGAIPGKNWVQIEFIDENGDIVQNVYNNTARVFTFEPGGNDTLSKLMRGELSFEEARSIVDRTYTYEPPVKAPVIEPSPEPEKVPEPLPVEEPKKAPEPKASETPKPEEKGSPEVITPPVVAPPVPAVPKGGFFNRIKVPEFKVPEVKIPEIKVPAIKVPEFKPSPAPSVEPDSSPVLTEEKEETPAPIKPKENFFDRMKRRLPKPSPVVVPTGEIKPEEETPTPSPSVVPSPVETPEVSKPATPKESFFDRARRLIPKPSPSIAPSPAEVPEVETAEPEAIVAPPEKAAPQENFLDRIKRGIPKPSPTAAPVEEQPTEPVEPEEPETPKPVVRENPFDRIRQALPKPSPSIAPVEEQPVEVEQKPAPNPFERFQPISKPSPAPEMEVAPSPEPSTDPNFKPQSELERRLGIPVKIEEPVEAPQPKKFPTQFQRSLPRPEPERQSIEVPSTLEAPE